jgi:hypothetical protein
VKGRDFVPRKGNKEKQKNQIRSVIFPADMLEQIEKIAAKKNIYASDVIRDFINKGLSVTGYEDNAEYLTGIIRQVVSAEMGRQANRLAAMLFKIGIYTVGGYFMLVRLMSDVISPSMHEDFKDIHSNARKLGIDYMKQNGVGVIEFLEDADEVEAAVRKLKTDLSEI